MNFTKIDLKKISRVLFSSLFLLLILCSPVFTAYSYTSPGKSTGFVNDFAGVLDEDSKKNLETELSDLEKQTAVEFSVVTVKSLEGDTIENFSHSLFTEWEIGKKATNKGLLLLIDMGDRKTRFEVGYGLEGTFPDLLTSKIQEQYLKPKFKDGDYIGGIQDTVGQISGILNGDVSVSEYLVPNDPVVATDGVDNLGTWYHITHEFFPFFLYFIFPIAIFFFQFLVYAMMRSKSFWLGGAIFGGVGFTLIQLYYVVFSSESATSFSRMSVIGIVSVASTLVGLLVDFRLSKKGTTEKTFKEFVKSLASGGSGSGFGFFSGSSRSSGSGGGFGGFGGGSSGGGGSNGSW